MYFVDKIQNFCQFATKISKKHIIKKLLAINWQFTILANNKLYKHQRR